jgi:hypothetical protein
MDTTMDFFGCLPKIVKFKLRTSQNVGVEQQSWIFGITKPRMTYVFIFDVFIMHEGQTRSSIA